MSADKQPSSGNVAEQVHAWFVGRVPQEWFEGQPEVFIDREEITVLGRLPGSAADAGTVSAPAAEAAAAAPARSASGAGSASAEADAAAVGQARRFREETREARIEIARDAEHAFGRKVSWGVVCAGKKVMFTTFSVPVMTRLRQSERWVLDTLVDAGVARSRSDALAWCVRLVGQHEDSWLAELREALSRVEQVRRGGPLA